MFEAISKNSKSEFLYEFFERIRSENTSNFQKFRILTPLVKVTFPDLLRSTVLKLIQEGLVYLFPVLTKLFIGELRDK